jgi:hypothetical protein
MTRLKALRDRVYGVLTPYLGQLKGSGFPAIWVDAGDAPAGCDGLLCVIERQPVASNRTPASGGSLVAEDWAIRLQARDRSPPGLAKFDAAIEALQHEFPIHRSPSIPTQDGDYPQYLLIARLEYFCSQFP